MSTNARTIIGPSDQGRSVAFDEYFAARFVEGSLYELARGVIEVTEVPDLWHGRIINRVTRMFIFYGDAHPGIIRYRSGGAECRVGVRATSSIRRPDQAVYLDPAPMRSNRVWEFWVPAIVVEVVDEESAHRDYVEKSEEYLAFGVQEYWILEPFDRALHVNHRVDDAWVVSVVSAGPTYQTPLLPGLAVRPDELLGPDHE
jgi:Uma2 family endonuclease